MTAPTRRSSSLPLVLAAAAAVTVLAGACASTSPANDPACPSHGSDVVRPTNGKMIAFAVAPKTIQYHFIDVRQDTLQYDWDTSQAYAGAACLRFQTTDSVHINPSGAFQFIMSGANGAYMRRHIVSGGATTNDSVIGYVFSGCEGTGGTYVKKADSTITLSWVDGTQSIILGPLALHQLAADTILWSSVSVSTHADSLRGSWRLAWIRAYCGEGF